MGLRQYNLGKQHGQRGVPRMSHRRTPYDGSHAQRSYDRGYVEGCQESLRKEKK